MDKNLEKWDQIYSQSKAGSFLSYPNENLITLFFQNRESINQEGKCLDYGFGSANNSEFLIQHMQELYGIEISRSCIDIAINRLGKNKNFNAKNFSLKGQEDGFEDFFDLVIAWHVLYYNDRDGLISAIKDLYRYIKPGGILIATLITNRDLKVKQSKEVGENTFLIDERIPHQAGCKIFSPSSHQEFLALFSEFDVIDSGYYERVSFENESSISEYYLIGKKK